MSNFRSDTVPPWSEDVCNALNEFQALGHYHPFTCPGDKAACAAHRELIATRDGWICACGEYRQDWYHPSMLTLRESPFSRGD